jgi:hypothetical protein
MTLVAPPRCLRLLSLATILGNVRVIAPVSEPLPLAGLPCERR